MLVFVLFSNKCLGRDEIFSWGISVLVLPAKPTGWFGDQPVGFTRKKQVGFNRKKRLVFPAKQVGFPGNFYVAQKFLCQKN